MEIQACFSDIAAVIAADLDRSEQSIEAAVAWLTDPAMPNYDRTLVTIGT